MSHSYPLYPTYLHLDLCDGFVHTTNLVLALEVKAGIASFLSCFATQLLQMSLQIYTSLCTEIQTYRNN